MATVTVTPDRDAILSETHIAAPAEQVFQALVDLERVLRWWGQAGGVPLLYGVQPRPPSGWKLAQRGHRSGTAGVPTCRRISGDRSSALAGLFLGCKLDGRGADYGPLGARDDWPGDARSESGSVDLLPIPRPQTATKAGRECWNGCGRLSRREKPWRCASRFLRSTSDLARTN